MDARLAAEGLSPLADDDAARLGEAQRAADRLPGRVLLCGAQGEAEAVVAGRGRSRNPRGLQEARHPDRGAEGADRKSVVSGRSVSVRVDLGGSRIIETTRIAKNQEET